MSNNIKKLSYIFSIVLVLSYFLAVYFNNNVFNLKLNWDEIDYVEAASKEFSSIMLEKDTLNLKDFLKLSYLKLRKKENEIIQFSNSLIPEESDSFLLRHYHPTFPILFWSFFINEDANKSTINLRVSNLVLLVLNLFLVIYILNREKIKNIKVYLVLLLININFFLSEYFLRNCIDLNYHNFYSLFMILVFYRYSKFLNNKNFKNIIFFSLSSALLINSLETFVFTYIIIVLHIIYLTLKKSLKISEIFKILFFMLFFILIICPGIIFSGGPIKSWIMYFYRIFLNANTEHQNVDFINLTTNLLTNNIIFLIIFITTFILFFIIKKKIFLIKILFIHAIVYYFLISNFLMMDRYLMPVLMSLIICFNYLFIKLFDKLKFNNIYFIFFLILILYQSSFNIFKKNENLEIYHQYDKEINKIISFINSQKNNNKFLIDGGHIFDFYTYNKNIHYLTYPTNTLNPEFLVRKNRLYTNIEFEIKRNYFDFIIIEKRRNYPESNYKILKESNYIFEETELYKIFSIHN